MASLDCNCSTDSCHLYIDNCTGLSGSSLGNQSHFGKSSGCWLGYTGHCKRPDKVRCIAGYYFELLS